MMATGMFINTNRISNVRLELNGHALFEYDHDMLQFVGQIVRDDSWGDRHMGELECLNGLVGSSVVEHVIGAYMGNPDDDMFMYWVPFDMHKHWLDKFGNHVNFGRIDESYVVFNKPHTGALHLLTYNELLVMEGMGGPRYV